MEGQQRKRYTSEEKVAILRKHLAGKKPVSEVCERHGIAVIGGTDLLIVSAEKVFRPETDRTYTLPFREGGRIRAWADNGATVKLRTGLKGHGAGPATIC